MLPSKIHRMSRIFRDDGKTLIVAMDHASSFGMMEGLEKPGELIRKVRAGGADALLTTYGVATQFADDIRDLGLILRVDGGTTHLSKDRAPAHLLYSVQDALRLGADAVGTMGMPGSCFEATTLPYLSELVGQGCEWNMPVMAEMLPGGFENPAEWWTPENVGHACRIGAEAGVDFIKTTFSGSTESFRQIVSQMYVPIVVLGGGKTRDPRELLESILEAIGAGASGVAIGRNIYRYPQPDKMTAAIAAVIHGGATVDAALDLLK